MTDRRADFLSQIQLPPLRRLTGQLDSLVRTRLWLQVLLAMGLGVGTGLLLGPSVGWVPAPLSETLTRWLALPGQLFLSLIRMIVVPLVFASVVRGLSASEDMGQLRRLGLRAVGFFVVTTAMSIGIGLLVAALLEPGTLVDLEGARSLNGSVTLPEGAVSGDLPSMANIPELITGLIPDNPLESMVGSQMLQVILFAAVFGIALVSLAPEKSAPMYDLLGSLQEICMAVVRGAMRLAPIAVFGLLARLTARVGIEVLAGLAGYVATVLLGLFVLGLVYLLMIATLGRRSPLQFLRATREVLLLAFSTSSSAAVMPLSIETAEDALGVRPAIARFLIPLGTTINMNGTALYQGVATMFLAQVYGVDLTISALALVVVTATAASIGSPATPGVGIVILATVLGSVGIPPAGIALVIGVDRILDMSRTATNVAGDLTAAVVLDRWAGRDDTVTPEEPAMPDGEAAKAAP